MGIPENLKRLRAREKLSQAALGKKSGTSQQLISQLERGENLSTKFLPQIAKALNASIYEVDENYLEEGTPLAATEVPLISWVSAGMLASDAAIDEAIGTARAVLYDSDWIALRVEGESMDRISPPGSIIFVDRSDKRLVTGGFYVIDDGEGNATYKRFVMDGGEMKFEPVSKNKELPAFYPDNEPTIVGRVKLTMLDLT